MYQNYSPQLYQPRNPVISAAKIGIGFAVFTALNYLLIQFVYSTYSLGGSGAKILDWIFDNEWANIFFFMTYTVGFAVICFFWADRDKLPPLRRRIHTNVRDLPFRPLDFLIFFCMLYAAIVIMNMLSEPFFRATVGAAQEAPEFLEESEWFVSAAVYSGVIAPIIEEIVRWCMFRPLEKFGKVSAVAITAVYFGVMHGNWYQLFYAIPGGIILGWAMGKYHSLFFNIVLHGIFNLSNDYQILIFDSENVILGDITAYATLAFLVGGAGLILYNAVKKLFPNWTAENFGNQNIRANKEGYYFSSSRKGGNYGEDFVGYNNSVQIHNGNFNYGETLNTPVPNEEKRAFGYYGGGYVNNCPPEISQNGRYVNENSGFINTVQQDWHRQTSPDAFPPNPWGTVPPQHDNYIPPEEYNSDVSDITGNFTPDTDLNEKLNYKWYKLFVNPVFLVGFLSYVVYIYITEISPNTNR